MQDRPSLLTTLTKHFSDTYVKHRDSFNPKLGKRRTKNPGLTPENPSFKEKVEEFIKQALERQSDENEYPNFSFQYICEHFKGIFHESFLGNREKMKVFLTAAGFDNFSEGGHSNLPLYFNYTQKTIEQALGRKFDYSFLTEIAPEKQAQFEECIFNEVKNKISNKLRSRGIADTVLKKWIQEFLSKPDGLTIRQIRDFIKLDLPTPSKNLATIVSYLTTTGITTAEIREKESKSKGKGKPKIEKYYTLSYSVLLTAKEEFDKLFMVANQEPTATTTTITSEATVKSDEEKIETKKIDDSESMDDALEQGQTNNKRKNYSDSEDSDYSNDNDDRDYKDSSEKQDDIDERKQVTKKPRTSYPRTARSMHSFYQQPQDEHNNSGLPSEKSTHRLGGLGTRQK